MKNDDVHQPTVADGEGGDPPNKSQDEERPRGRRIYAALFSEGLIQDALDRTGGELLHELIGKGAESQLMDAAVGLGHRLRAGHDLHTLCRMVESQSAGGAETWFRHMFADLMSPDGIPLPGAGELHGFLKDTVGDVSARFAVDWTCVSATDVIAAGLSLLVLARIHKLAPKNRMMRLGTLTVGQVFLLALAETNPFFLATIPLQVLLAKHEWKKCQLERLQKRLDTSERVKREAEILLSQAKAAPRAV